MVVRLVAILLTLALAPHLALAAEQSELGKCMEAIGDAYKPLYRAFRGEPDADQVEQYLEWTRTIKENAILARDKAPSLAATLPEAEQQAMGKNFATDMDTFIKNIEALEKALLAGNLVQAQTLVQTLKTDRNEGHDKYQEEEE